MPRKGGMSVGQYHPSGKETGFYVTEPSTGGYGVSSSPHDDTLMWGLTEQQANTEVRRLEAELAQKKRGNKMPRKPIKKQPRRVRKEPEEVERELTDEGNPQELKDESTEPFEPKASAVTAGKAYMNLKAISDAFGPGGEHDLEKMDHPGMQEGLKALIDDDGPVSKAMQHLKELITEHHAKGEDGDEYMEKLCKSLETENAGDEPYDVHKDDSFEQGEDNLVDADAIPEGDLEPIDYDEPGDSEEEEVPPSAGGDDDDTEEIIERYQHPKTGQWLDRVVGKVWRDKKGRARVKVYKSYKKCVKDVEEKIVYGEDCEGDDQDNECRAMFAHQGKGLDDEGNPAELKSVQPEHLDTIKAAADHLNESANDPATPAMHKSAHKYHAKALEDVHKDLQEAGDHGPADDNPTVEHSLEDEGNQAELKGTGTYHCRNCSFSTQSLEDANRHEQTHPGHSIAKSVKSTKSAIADELAALREENQRINRIFKVNGVN
ncbi:MAG: hypothetical protein KGL39_32650 [Patescibacteria group bacterium]|nr:hypothetical protein [Patescibacteria group bacterium]